jgi:hypothetical protein
MRAQLIVLGLLLSLPAAAAEKLSCDVSTKASVTCSCDVRTLRPLQGAIGLEEVLAKKQKIAAHPERERRDLEDDPIKVIRGPGNELYITDHHHGADAWRLAGKPIALCEIGKGPAFNTDAEFWSGLERDLLVRLANADGKRLEPAQLPQSLKLMPDDPYRSLAWLVRKNGGFCRSEMKQKEFAEFVWADWLRKQPELPAAAVGASAKKMLPKALELVRGPAAKDMDGYVGSKPSGFKCPKEG